MWLTIAIAFIVTVLLVGYANSKFRTRNYRVSLWHYFMASNEVEQTESGTEQHDTCKPPGDEINPSENTSESGKVAAENGDGMEQSHSDTNEQGKEIKVETSKSPENEPENSSKNEEDPKTEEIPNNSSEEMETAAQSGPMETQEKGQTSGPMEVQSKDTSEPRGNEPMEISGKEETEETGTATKDDSDPNVEKPDDTKNNPEDDGTAGEWQTPEKSNKNSKKGANNNSPKTSPKGVGKESGAEGASMSPSDRGLRMTKDRKQKEWKQFVNKNLSKELQKLMGGSWATEDTERYLDGYPKANDYPEYNLNLEFYQNRLPSSPSGDYIDDIHKYWWGNYDLLERHHGYIQWLFPIQEQGLNHQAQPLQKHEIKMLKSDDDFQNRLIRSYEFMLDFFGMKLANRKTGEIARSKKNQWQQYGLLNSSFHNYLRITRILKCLGEFDLEHFQAQFCRFVISEIFKNGELTNTLKSCLSYWGKVIKNFEERKEFYSVTDQFFIEDLQKKKGSIVRKELYRYY